jgi:hypothetical protein
MLLEKFFSRMNVTGEIFSIGFEDKELRSENRFFSDVHLYDDLKQLLSRMLLSKESVHCALVGPLHLEKQYFCYQSKRT